MTGEQEEHLHYGMAGEARQSEIHNQMQKQTAQWGILPVGVHPPVHVGPSMEQLKNVFVLAPLEANLVVQNLQPQCVVCRSGQTLTACRHSITTHSVM